MYLRHDHEPLIRLEFRCNVFMFHSEIQLIMSFMSGYASPFLVAVGLGGTFSKQVNYCQPGAAGISADRAAAC